MSSDAPLCQICRRIFLPEIFNVEEEYSTAVVDYVRSDTLPDLPVLHEEANKGCPFCTELKKRISALEWPKDVRDVTIGSATWLHESFWESELSPEQEGIVLLEVQVSCPVTPPHTLHFEVFAHAGSFASTHMRVRRLPPSTDRYSSACIERLQQMISKCAGVHWQCEPGNEDFWPTRVIDVGAVDETADPRLVVTSGPASRYVALSHCWGKPGPGVRMLKTLSTDIQSHMLGIPLESTPLNFQHAIFVTRALGLSSDWAKEGAQMDKVYRSAFVTLAATSASTSEDGFLDYMLADKTFTIPLPRYPDRQLAVGSPDTVVTESIVARYMEGRDTQHMETDVDGSTWNERAWTLQERHLARRIIHFSANQIFWECRRGFASECGYRIMRLPVSLTRTYGADSSSEEFSDEDVEDAASPLARSGSEISERLSTSEGSDSESDSWDHTLATRSAVYFWWFQILADYSRRKLTFASDKFPAISGLVKELNHTLLTQVTYEEDQYIAGLWLGALADSLLWAPERPEAMTDPADPGVYRAPSWSWARWDGATIPYSRGGRWPDIRPEDSTIEYIGHDVELNTLNEYGSIRLAFLTLRAGIAQIVRKKRYTENNTAGRTMGTYHIAWEDAGESLGFMTYDQIGLMGSEEASDHLYAMQVKVHESTSSTPNTRCGLVLRLGTTAGTYERVGTFQLDDEHSGAFSTIEREDVILV
ncbi:unnamed protein product [Alternaria alternata]